MNSLKLFLFSVSILFSSQVFAMEKSSRKDLNKKLLQAIENENIEEAKYLIESGADINAKDKHGWNALMIAASFKPEVIKCLIDHLQLNNIKLDDANVKYNYSWIGLLIAANFEPKSVKYIIDYFKSNNIQLDVNAKDKNGKTALVWAVCFSSKAVKYLIDYCQSNKIQLDVNAKSNDGETALMRAINSNESEIAKYLIQAGVDVNIKDNDGSTALELAVLFSNLKTAKNLVLAGADLNQIKNKYPTEYQSVLNIKLLFELFKNYKINKDQIENCIKLFAKQSSLIKFFRDLDGNTLLHYAAMKEDVQLFGLICSICPSLIATTNDNNQTPIQLALGNKKIFELIKKFALVENSKKKSSESHQSDDDEDDDSVHLD